MTEKHTVSYEIVRPIAQGGMGWVYEGRAVTPWGHTRPVAIKLMHPEKAEDSDAVALFHREVEISLSLNHSHANLVTTFGCGVADDGRPYLVMEYVEGVSLSQLTRGDLAGDESFFAVVRRIAYATLRGLLHLHSHGYIHRDVSPGNILLGRDGSIKLADMGMTKALTSQRSERFRGTVPYASLEALNGRRAAVSFDLYSLAAVLYELIAGDLPYGDGKPGAIVQNMADKEPRLPETTPSDLRELVNGLIEMHPQDRAFHSALECLEFLQEHGQPIADDAVMQDLTTRLLPRAQQALSNQDIELPVLHAPKSPDGQPRTLNKLLPSLIVVLGFTGYLLWLATTKDTSQHTSPQSVPIQEVEEAVVECEGPALLDQPSPVATDSKPAAERPDRRRARKRSLQWSSL
jgi:serine/threonine protein kinase